MTPAGSVAQDGAEAIKSRIAETRVWREQAPLTEQQRAERRRLWRLAMQPQPPSFVVVIDECGCVVAVNKQPFTDRMVEMLPGATSREAVRREATADRMPCVCYSRQSEVLAAARVASDELSASLLAEATQ